MDILENEIMDFIVNVSIGCLIILIPLIFVLTIFYQFNVK